MRIAIISDTHLGDTNSVMAFRDKTSGEIIVGSKYREFIKKVRDQFNGVQVDFLVLLGDILDFSISSYPEAYAIGQFFFQKLKDDNICREIIYVPGNHDYDIWHSVEYATNVTNRINNKKLPIPFRQSVPAILDDRQGTNMEGLTLLHVTPKNEDGGPKYAGLFMDNITDPPSHFNFVYPNIYLITHEESIIITHGQYLDVYWSVLGKWGLKIINGDLDLRDPRLMDLKEMVQVNFPLCQLNSSGLGQAGPLTFAIQKLEHEIKEKYFVRLNSYFYRLDKEIKEKHKGLTRLFLRWALKLVKHEALKALSRTKPARYREDFQKNPAVCERTQDYYSSSIYEIGEIEKIYDVKIPFPTTMIFGHTHKPIPFGSSKAPLLDIVQLPEGKKLVMYNTGGWLSSMSHKKQPQFCGAEIFFYETGKGISSVSITEW